jgi:hypothetical protein
MVDLRDSGIRSKALKEKAHKRGVGKVCIIIHLYFSGDKVLQGMDFA